MNGDRAFFDTNILVYLYSDHETDKQNKAFDVFNKSGVITRNGMSDTVRVMTPK